MNNLPTMIFLLTLTCTATWAPAQDPENALGTFTSQVTVLPGTTRASFIPGQDRALVLRPGRDLRMIDLLEEGAPLFVEDGDFTAMTVLEDGSWLAFDADAQQIVHRDLPSSGASGILDLRQLDRLQDGVDPFMDVVALEPHPDGILIVERSPHRVRVIGWDGAEHLRLGGKGSGEGEFIFPADAAVDSTGGIYVVDRDNHRVQRFAPDGTFVDSWGGRGAFPGLVSAPVSIDIEGDLIYVAEELNHRVSVFDSGGRFLYQWGMHPLVPRKGEGAIHYPMSVDVSSDGSRALVAEPFERRLQSFERFPGGIEEARTQPLPSKESILSHFGPFLAADDDLLAMWEPESGAVTVFDVSGDTGINITVFTNHGSGWDDLGRLGALHLDADAQEFIVSDVVNDRLQIWRLERDRDAMIKYDPFMARLATAVDLKRTLRQLETLAPDRTWKTPRIEAFARSHREGAPLLAADTANHVIISFDDQLDPIGIGVDCQDPVALVREGSSILLVEADGTCVPLASDGTRAGPTKMLTGDHPVGGAALHEGVLYHSARESDRMESTMLAIPGATGPAWGRTGDADGLFYAPSGVAVIADGRIVVVDQGNHRAQIFSAQGDWLSTFSLSSGYTTPRRRSSEDASTEEER
jgi:DNA-binding beta-propeller fold protein YncE